MIKERMNQNLESSMLNIDTSLIDKPLSNAVCDFRKDYVLAVAFQTAKFDIYAMSRELNYDRSELSKFVNETSVKPQILELQRSYDPSDWYIKNYSQASSPITKEVIAQSILENDFDIKKATTRFKKKYVTQKVYEYGIKKAAEVLDVNERTVRNYLNADSNMTDPDITARLN